MSGLALEARRLLLIQLALTTALTVGFAVFGGLAGAAAVAFGGLTALGNAWSMALTVAKATAMARTHPGTETQVLLIGALKRFVLVAAMFAVGIGAMELPPVQLIVGFAVVHGAFFLARVIVDAPSPAASRDSKGE